MEIAFGSARGNAAPPGPAVVAAIVAVLEAAVEPCDDAIAAAAPASPWRAAGRSIEAFDAYDAARHERAARRGSAR